MSMKRRVAAVVAVFLTSQVLAILSHGFILARDYAPFYGSLLRQADNPGWPIFMLPAAHLATSVAFVALLERTLRDGPVLPQALRFGVLAYLLGPVPMYLLWFAEQPWPSSLLVKQLPLELATFLILGAVAGAIVRRGRAERSNSGVARTAGR